MFYSVIHDILNLHQPLFDHFLSKLFHLRMVKHYNFICYYKATRMKISTVVKFNYRVAIRCGFRGRIDFRDKAIICDVKGKRKSLRLHSLPSPPFLI